MNKIIFLLILVSTVSYSQIRLDSVQAINYETKKVLITSTNQIDFINKLVKVTKKKTIPKIIIKNFYKNKSTVEYKITLKDI